MQRFLRSLVLLASLFCAGTVQSQERASRAAGASTTATLVVVITVDQLRQE